MTHTEALAQIRMHSTVVCGKQHPAVNVKVYNLKTPKCIPDNKANEIWEQIVSKFWNDFALDIAKKYGYDGIFSEGRSDGWCTPYYKADNFTVAHYPDIENDEKEAFKFLQFQEEILKKVESRKEDYTDLCEDWIKVQRGFNKLECPYCHKIIDSIKAHGQMYSQCDIWGAKGELQYGDFDYGDIDYHSFQCPECYHELTRKEVAKILNISEDEIPTLIKN